jgi:hypothetical protein
MPGRFDAPAMGIAFTPLGDSDAAQAVLPDEKAGLTRDEALDLAGKHAGASIDPRQIPGVEYAAQYGIFSDTQVTNAHATRASLHPLANRVAWVVQYFGPGVQIPSDGPAGAPVIYSHKVSVAIDAATGDFIEMYVG